MRGPDWEMVVPSLAMNIGVDLLFVGCSLSYAGWAGMIFVCRSAWAWKSINIFFNEEMWHRDFFFPKSGGAGGSVPEPMSGP